MLISIVHRGLSFVIAACKIQSSSVLWSGVFSRFFVHTLLADIYHSNKNKVNVNFCGSEL